MKEVYRERNSFCFFEISLILYHSLVLFKDKMFANISINAYPSCSHNFPFYKITTITKISLSKIKSVLPFSYRLRVDVLHLADSKDVALYSATDNVGKALWFSRVLSIALGHCMWSSWMVTFWQLQPQDVLNGVSQGMSWPVLGAGEVPPFLSLFLPLLFDGLLSPSPSLSGSLSFFSLPSLSMPFSYF